MDTEGQKLAIVEGNGLRAQRVFIYETQVAEYKMEIDRLAWEMQEAKMTSCNGRRNSQSGMSRHLPATFVWQLCSQLGFRDICRSCAMLVHSGTYNT